MLKYIRYSLSFFICSMLMLACANSLENKIILKVNNDIITSLDILHELEYLKIINPEIRNTKKEDSIKISKNSLIKEKIKEIQITRIIKEVKIDNKILKNILLNYFKEFGIETISEFEKFFSSKNIDPDLIKRKITLEVLWNQLIYEKYKKNVKIDKQSIINNLKKNNKQSEFLLSEILFNVNENENLNEKFKLINNSISKINFSKTALAYSISDTANKGGNLGWISESILSDKIYNKLKKLKIGEHTKPILIPGGFLILKILDMRETKKNLDFDDEVKKIVNEKTNQQLNRFSNIYFNKIKNDITINEF